MKLTAVHLPCMFVNKQGLSLSSETINILVFVFKKLHEKHTKCVSSWWKKKRLYTSFIHQRTGSKIKKKKKHRKQTHINLT